MPETKRIRFTEDGFFGIKAGDEFEVRYDSDDGYFIVCTRHVHHEQGMVVYLSELEGFYEEVRWKPTHGGAYSYLDSTGQVVTTHDTSSITEMRCEYGNVFPATEEGRKLAEAVAEKQRAIFKEGV